MIHRRAFTTSLVEWRANAGLLRSNSQGNSVKLSTENASLSVHGSSSQAICKQRGERNFLSSGHAFGDFACGIVTEKEFIGFEGEARKMKQ